MLAASTAYTSAPSSEAYGQITTEASTVATHQLAVTSNSKTEAAVREYFKDIPVMIQVARCESQFRHTLADGTVLHGVVDSADTGVMQINKRYHASAAAAMGLSLDDLHGNMAYARHLYETQGTRPWNASSPCWGKTLAMNI
jgi:hypothetical protein